MPINGTTQLFLSYHFHKMGNLKIGLLLALLVLSNVLATSKYYDIFIYEVNLTRLCQTTVTLTANGTFPGPTIFANKGQTLYVNIHNNGTHGTTVHWHGVLQPRNSWYDGPLDITQYLIQPGSNFTYKIVLSKEEGTIWYHAHSYWSMATVHGAIVIHPPNRQYPYPTVPDGEQTIMLATWYIQEVMELYKFIKGNNLYFPRANATTINGEPGYPNNCSAGTSFKMTVKRNKTYLLRVVNAILNEDQFFGISGHNLTLVGHDGAYTKPLTTEYIRIAPGQTMDVLFTANQKPGCYFMAAAPFFVGINLPGLTNTTTSAIVGYEGYCNIITDPSSVPYPKLPALGDSDAALNFTNSIRSINSRTHPAIVPKSITKNVTIRAGVGDIGIVPVGFLNNITFVYPEVSILEAYVRNETGYFEEDFPSKLEDSPDFQEYGTRALIFNYSDVVQIVFESNDNHPMHIHGFTLYVVATGQGTFDDVKDNITTCTESTDPSTPCYNFVDPPELNTVSIPAGGFVVVRFVADNPGVWFVHCHFERHMTTGMSTVFIVKNGTTSEESMLPAPKYMPPFACKAEKPYLSTTVIDSFLPFTSY